jgi:hypothetical protein
MLASNDLGRMPPAGRIHTKTEIWDLAAGTFIAVSILAASGFIIASAIQ